MAVFSRISQLAVHIPERRESGEEIEHRLRLRNPHLRVEPGVLRQMYGFQERRVAPEGTLPSDLATAAARQALETAGLDVSEVELLIHAAVSEDMEEPATSHIVAHKLGAGAAVFDVKNACNGVLNAIEVADAFIRCGQYRSVLIVTGEMGSRVARWDIPDRRELALSLPGLTTGDMGAAILLQADTRPGVLGTRFTANSAAWTAATLPNPYFGDGRPAVLRVDSEALAAAFLGMDTLAREALEKMGHRIEDVALACVHQASVSFTRMVCDSLGLPPEKVVSTFPRYGNVTTASLPLQLLEAVDQGRVKEGDLVVWFGLASGASGGFALIQW